MMEGLLQPQQSVQHLFREAKAEVISHVNRIFDKLLNDVLIGSNGGGYVGTCAHIETPRSSEHEEEEEHVRPVDLSPCSKQQQQHQQPKNLTHDERPKVNSTSLPGPDVYQQFRNTAQNTISNNQADDALASTTTNVKIETVSSLMATTSSPPLHQTQTEFIQPTQPGIVSFPQLGALCVKEEFEGQLVRRIEIGHNPELLDILNDPHHLCQCEQCLHECEPCVNNRSPLEEMHHQESYGLIIEPNFNVTQNYEQTDNTDGDKDGSDELVINELDETDATTHEPLVQNNNVNNEATLRYSIEHQQQATLPPTTTTLLEVNTQIELSISHDQQDGVASLCSDPVNFNNGFSDETPNVDCAPSIACSSPSVSNESTKRKSSIEEPLRFKLNKPTKPVLKKARFEGGEFGSSDDSNDGVTNSKSAQGQRGKKTEATLGRNDNSRQAKQPKPGGGGGEPILSGYRIPKRTSEPTNQVKSPAKVPNHHHQLSSSSLSKYKQIFLHCNKCSLKFEQKGALQHHQQREHHMRPHRCLYIYCNDSFWLESELEFHLKLCHPEVRDWECKHCSKHCHSEPLLLEHIHLEHEEGNFRCTFPDCDHSCSYRAESLNHHDREHTHSAPAIDHSTIRRIFGTTNPPQEAQEPAKSSSSTENHPTTATTIINDVDKYTVEMVKCSKQDCYLYFASVPGMEAHLKKDHFKKPVLCIHEGCTSSFAESDHMCQHIKTKHCQVKLWSCSTTTTTANKDCQFSTANPGEMYLHQYFFHQTGWFRCNAPRCKFEDKHRGTVVRHFDRAHRK